MQKCRELNAEIVANAAKVTTALKLSQEDKATISSLKQVWYSLVHRPIPSFSLLHAKKLGGPGYKGRYGGHVYKPLPT